MGSSELAGVMLGRAGERDPASRAGHRIYNSNSGKVGTMRHQTHTVLFLLICLATQAKLSEIVEGSGDEEFDQDAAINEAVNKVTELVTSWADNLEDIDMDLEINQMENEVTDEKAGKRKRKCEKCERKIFRARNSEFCESCQEEETVEVTIAITTIDSYRRDEGWRSDARNVRRTLSVLVMKTFAQLNAHWRKITWRKKKQQ